VRRRLPVEITQEGQDDQVAKARGHHLTALNHRLCPCLLLWEPSGAVGPEMESGGAGNGAGGSKWEPGGGGRNGAGPRNGAGGPKWDSGGLPRNEAKRGGVSQKRNSREPEVKRGVQRCIDVLLEHKHSSRSVQDKDNSSHHLHLIPFRVFCAWKHTVCLKTQQFYKKGNAKLDEKRQINWRDYGHVDLAFDNSQEWKVLCILIDRRTTKQWPPTIPDIVCVTPIL